MQRPSRSQRQQQQQSEHRQQAGLTEATVATDAIGGTGGEAAGRNLWAAADGRGDGSSAGYPSDDEEALGMQTAEPDLYDPNADDEVRRCSANCSGGRRSPCELLSVSVHRRSQRTRHVQSR